MDAEREGIWAVVECFNKKFIGKIVAIRDKNPAAELMTKDTVLGADWICLSPCFDYFSPMRPVQTQGPGGQPSMAMTRDQFTMPYENVLGKAAHWVRMTGIDFLEDLENEDQAMFYRFVEQVQKQQLEARARASGIVLPGAATMPSYGRPARG